MQDSVVDNSRPELNAKFLTPRQREIVALLAEGKTAGEVALVLNMSESGVRYHQYKVMRKLNFKKSILLIRFAINSGILIS